MPIRELCHFTVRRFFGTGKTPSGGFTRADGRVRDRDQPGARARIHERVHADALVWFSNLSAISNPPNGTWLQPSPSRYREVKRPGKPPFPLVDNTSTCSNNFCFKVSGANERICPDQQDPDIRAPGTPRPSNENYCDTSMRSLLFQWRGVRRGRAPKEFPVSGGMERCIGECT